MSDALSGIKPKL